VTSHSFCLLFAPWRLCVFAFKERDRVRPRRGVLTTGDDRTPSSDSSRAYPSRQAVDACRRCTLWNDKLAVRAAEGLSLKLRNARPRSGTGLQDTAVRFRAIQADKPHGAVVGLWIADR